MVVPPDSDGDAHVDEGGGSEAAAWVVGRARESARLRISSRATVATIASKPPGEATPPDVQRRHALKGRMRRALPILGLWCALSVGLTVVTTRVRDWYSMPNELLYERRAIGVAHDLSLLPRVRGQLVATFDQLYPVLIAPAFRWGSVPDSLLAAHALNAWIMASACIPAFLLARRVTRAVDPVGGRGALRGDAVDPVRVAADDRGRGVPGVRLGDAGDAGRRRRTVAPARRAGGGGDRRRVSRPDADGAARPRAAGRDRRLRARPLRRPASRTSRGTASRATASWRGPTRCARSPPSCWRPAGKLPRCSASTARRSAGPARRSRRHSRRAAWPARFVEHAATFSLGMGILPFVVGCAWLLSNLVRPPRNGELHAFACLGAIVGGRAARRGHDLRPALRRQLRARPLPLLPRSRARAGVPVRAGRATPAALVARRAGGARRARLRRRRDSHVHVAAVRDDEPRRADRRALPSARPARRTVSPACASRSLLRRWR